MFDVMELSQPGAGTRGARCAEIAKIKGFLAILLAGTLGGCVGKPPAAPSPAPVPVTVANPVQKQVVEWDTFTGNLQAPESVNVSSRVSGLVVDTPFVEGSIVKKGDVLYVIDDAPFKTELESKVADERKAESGQINAKLTFDRLLGLKGDNAVSQQDIDNAKAAVDQAAAVVASAKAAVDTANRNLGYTQVRSKIDGRVSNKRVTIGNQVTGGEGQGTLLTTVESVDPMYCNVDIDEHSVLKYQKLAQEKKLASARSGKVPCFVQLINETGFPHAGFIDFVDNHVDPNTGTLRERGVLKNTDGLLIPGQFARLVIPGSGQYQALLIPDTAVGNDQNQKTVLVVNSKNVVESRIVEIGALFGGLRSIVSGLKPSDEVIINGQMHARPGATVAPTFGKINLDAAAFASPGGGAAPTIPTTDASAQKGTLSTPASGTEPTDHRPTTNPSADSVSTISTQAAPTTEPSTQTTTDKVRP